VGLAGTGGDAAVAEGHDGRAGPVARQHPVVGGAALLPLLRAELGAVSGGGGGGARGAAGGGTAGGGEPRPPRGPAP
jgi:hypothetical protein